jgi:hypothetical protein
VIVLLYIVAVVSRAISVSVWFIRTGKEKRKEKERRINLSSFLYYYYYYFGVGVQSVVCVVVVVVRFKVFAKITGKYTDGPS